MKTYSIFSNPSILSLVVLIALCLGTSCEKASFEPAKQLTAPKPEIVDKESFDPVREIVAPAPDVLHGEKADAPVTIGEGFATAPFDFDILKQYCTLNGASLQVMIDQPEQYAFSWAIDGNHGGHETYAPDCSCGTQATVFITRLSDGSALRQSVKLPPCTPDQY